MRYKILHCPPYFAPGKPFFTCPHFRYQAIPEKHEKRTKNSDPASAGPLSSTLSEVIAERDRAVIGS
jgi:hypothetical protein